MDTTPDRTNLSHLEKGNKECMREYAQRLKDLVVKVHPPLLDKEMITLFANTFKASYYKDVIDN